MPLRLIVKSMNSSGIDDIRIWVPDDVFLSITIEIEIGTTGEDGADLFQLTVYNISSLSKLIEQKKLVSMKHSVVLLRYDYSMILNHIQSVLSSFAGQNWDDATAYLSRYFSWEYEDYTV